MKIRNLDKLAPKHRRRYVLPSTITAENGNGKPLVLSLVHAGDHNRKWRDAVDKVDAQGSGTANGEEWVRARIAPLARYVIVGWENAFDEAGKAEVYTAAAGEKMLLDLMELDKETGKPVAGDVVLRIIMYAADANNFREADGIDDGASERLGKRVAAWLKWKEKAAPIERQLRIDRTYKPNRKAKAILAARPPLDSAMRRCLIAWHQLSKSRPSELGARIVKGSIVPYTRRGAIPYEAIVTWAEHNEIDREVTELVIEVIGRLDDDRDEAHASKENLG